MSVADSTLSNSTGGLCPKKGSDPLPHEANSNADRNGKGSDPFLGQSPTGVQAFGESDFSYRPIPLLVPISLGFVFLSLVGAMLAELLVVPAIGVCLALLAWRQIRLARGALSGGMLAKLSLLTQLLMFVGFASMHAYVFATELPPGYERINFTADISKKGFAIENGIQTIHPDVKKLSNRKIMVKGYMYPTKQTQGLTSFVLCRDRGQCCFGGQPKVTDMIQVQMAGNRFVDYVQGMVTVAGEFLTEPTVDETGLQPVYQLKCDHFTLSKTWY